MRPVRRGAHRESTRKVTVRAGRVLQVTIPKPTDALRETSSATTVPPHRQLTSHRTAFLRQTGREDTHRDSDPRHVAQWKQLQLALHDVYVTQRMAPAGLSIVFP